MPLESVDILLLGSGWTGTFFIPLLDLHHKHLSYATTTRNGAASSIKWTWDDTAEGGAQFEQLPSAKTVVIVFPIKGQGYSKRLVEGYESIHGPTRWVQLGSSGIFDGGPTLEVIDLKPTFQWTDRHSPYATDNARAIAEDELLSLRHNSFVLNLSGLWGGERDPLNWIPRIAPTKEALATKNSVHLIHGLDVARAIVAVHLSPSPQPISSEKKHPFLGQRYVLTDLRVYCWFDLISAWGTAPPNSLSTTSASYNPGANGVALLGDQAKWVLELMEERGIRALPRTPEQLGRAIDSRDFWKDFGLMPLKGRLERGRL